MKFFTMCVSIVLLIVLIKPSHQLFRAHRRNNRSSEQDIRDMIELTEEDYQNLEAHLWNMRLEQGNSQNEVQNSQDSSQINTAGPRTVLIEQPDRSTAVATPLPRRNASGPHAISTEQPDQSTQMTVRQSSRPNRNRMRRNREME